LNKTAAVINDAGGNFDIAETVRELEEEMLEAANNLEFEKAALLRDQVRELQRLGGGGERGPRSAVRGLRAEDG
jgi:excinuclease ABC subunit B